VLEAQICVTRPQCVKLVSKMLCHLFIVMLQLHVCIPRSFLVINVCYQGRTLCSPCTFMVCTRTALPIRVRIMRDCLPFASLLSINEGSKLLRCTFQNFESNGRKVTSLSSTAGVYWRVGSMAQWPGLD